MSHSTTLSLHCPVAVGVSKETKWLSRSFNGGTQEVRTPHGPHGRRNHSNMFKTVAQRCLVVVVPHRWLKEGTTGGLSIVMVTAWRLSGRPMVTRYMTRARI